VKNLCVIQQPTVCGKTQQQLFTPQQPEGSKLTVIAVHDTGSQIGKS
jgi:hypothetical protein